MISKASIAQLFFSGFPEGIDASTLRSRHFPHGIGGLVHFSRNVNNADQLSKLNAALQLEFGADTSEAGQLPLAIGVDQEGGRVQRIKAPVCKAWPAAATCDESGAHAVGAGIGQELKSMGFNFDFAPVLDVVNNTENTVIGDRSYAADPEQVARCAISYARGLQASGILSCGKHFPGHGGPVADSHHEVPVDERALDELMQSDLTPFFAAAEYALPMLMTAHVRYPKIDADNVATYSSSIMNELLRDKMGYTGVLITDDLDMAASVETTGTLEQAAEKALLAGCDALLVCHSYDRVTALIEHLQTRANQDTRLFKRIHTAYNRLKTYYRLLS